MGTVRKNFVFWVILILIINYGNAEAHPPPSAPSTPHTQPIQQQQQHNVKSFRNALNQQGIQSLLQSIENRLSNLDQIYSHRYSQRVDLNTDQLARKIEMLESKLTRLESSLDAQLEKLSENLSSKNTRDDITKDQIFRKVDSLYERFNHKLTYVEEKFDMAIFKLQNRIEMGMTKIERLDDSINVRNADMESEIAEGVQIVKGIRNNINTLEEKIIDATRASTQSLEKSDIINTNLVKALWNIESKIGNMSLPNQNEYYRNLTRNIPPYNYDTKINDMYNELWKKINTIENDIKNSVELMNSTQEEIQDFKYKTHNFSQQNDDDSLDTMFDSFKISLQKKFSDLGRKMDDNFKNIIATQNLFLESCKSSQMDETQLERKISLDLEKLLEALSNRNLVSFKELQSTEQIIKNQGNNMERLIHQNTNTIMKLSEKTSDDRKKIEKILSIVKKDLTNFMTTIQHEINLGSLERSEIGNLILELQAQVNDLDRKMNKDNMNYNAKQIQTLQLDDVLKQTKDIFAKQLNTSTIHNTINRVDDSVKDIHKLLHDIYIKINKCEHLHKLNVTQINSDYNGEMEEPPTTPPNERVDIVIGDSSSQIKNLFRYNYSVVNDNKRVGIPEASTIPSINKTNITTNNTDKINPISTEKPKSIGKSSNQTKIMRKNNPPAINVNKHDDVPAASTVPTINKTNTTSNNDDEDEINPVSSEEHLLTKDENISSEKSYEENSTNSIISADNKSESSTTKKPCNAKTTAKSDNKEVVEDILDQLYTKFFGRMVDNDDSSDSIVATTELTDIDYEDHFYD